MYVCECSRIGVYNKDYKKCGTTIEATREESRSYSKYGYNGENSHILILEGCPLLPILALITKPVKIEGRFHYYTEEDAERAVGIFLKHDHDGISLGCECPWCDDNYKEMSAGERAAFVSHRSNDDSVMIFTDCIGYSNMTSAGYEPLEVVGNVSFFSASDVNEECDRRKRAEEVFSRFTN